MQTLVRLYMPELDSNFRVTGSLRVGSRVKTLPACPATHSWSIEKRKNFYLLPVVRMLSDAVSQRICAEHCRYWPDCQSVRNGLSAASTCSCRTGSVVVNVTDTGSNYWLPDGRRAGLPVAAKHRRLQQRLINNVHAAASNAVTIPLPVCPRHASRPFRWPPRLYYLTWAGYDVVVSGRSRLAVLSSRRVLAPVLRVAMASSSSRGGNGGSNGSFCSRCVYDNQQRVTSTAASRDGQRKIGWNRQWSDSILYRFMSFLHVSMDNT